MIFTVEGPAFKHRPREERTADPSARGMTRVRGAALMSLPFSREAQPRPRLIDRADFVIHTVVRQAKFPNNIFGEIGGNARGLLGPPDPQRRPLGQRFRK